MRIGLFFILGVFLWAGTVSIKYPEQPSSGSAISVASCPDHPQGDRLLAYLKLGSISSIHDNGKILTIGLSPKWGNLTPGVQKQTYRTVACYAKTLKRPFQFVLTQQM